MKRHLPLLGRVLGASAALAVAFFYVFPRFGPGSAYVVPYNSDQAIPILMANDEWRGLFSVFYYGQDRLGSWPWGILHVLRELTGIVWTPESVFVFLMIAFTSGLVALIALHRHAGLVIGAGTLLTFVLHPVARQQLADFAQPYGYQAACLAGCWWTLRRTLAAESSAVRHGFGLGFFVLSALVIWLSRVSIPLLFWMGIVELLRLPAGEWKARLKQSVPVVLGLFAAVLFEVILRDQFHRHALALYQDDYRSSIAMDTGHLLANVKAMSKVFWSGTAWPVAVLGVIGAAGGLWVLWRRPQKLEETARELYLAALVLVVGAAGNLAITMLVNHVRANAYADRYLALTHLWWTTGAVCAAVAIAIGVFRRAHQLAPFSAAAVFLAALGFAPPPQPSQQIVTLRAIAEELAKEPGPQLLIGSYWQTYLFASLAPPGELIGIPKTGNYTRTPFDSPKLAEADWVWFSDETLRNRPPRPFRSEHGQLLKLLQLDEPTLFRREEYGFARYRRVPTEQQPLEDVDLCVAGSTIRVSLGSPAPRVVLLETTRHTPQLQPAGPVRKVEALPGFIRMELSESASGTLEIATGPEAKILSEPSAEAAVGAALSETGSSKVKPAAEAPEVRKFLGAHPAAMRIGSAGGPSPADLTSCPISAAWLIRE